MRFSFSSSSPMRTGIVRYKSRWGRQLSYISDTFCQAKITLKHEPQTNAPPPVATRRSEAHLGIRRGLAVHRVTGPDRSYGSRTGLSLPRRSAGGAKAGVPMHPPAHPGIP